jgi:hypothetical protein
MRIAFAVAATLIVVSLVVALANQARAARTVSLGSVVDTRILGMTILGAEPRVAKTHPPSPRRSERGRLSWPTRAVRGCSSSLMSEGSRSRCAVDWLKRSDDDARGPRVDDCERDYPTSRTFAPSRPRSW